jgi:integrase
MRPSEAMNLREEELVLTVHGDHQVPAVRITKIAVSDYKPKTASSYRDIPIDPALWQRLKQIAPSDGSPIFGTPNKNDYPYWRGRILKIIKARELNHLRFWDFRKHRSSQLIDASCPKAAYSDLMGHSERTALEHYAMATP